MRNLWFFGLLFSLVFGSCSTVPVSGPRDPLSAVQTPVDSELSTPALPESSPELSLPVAEGPSVPLQRPPGTAYARYLVTTVPPGVGVLREGGDLVGLTPLTVILDSPRAFRLTFLKKGFQIFSRYIKPEEGDHELNLIMDPEPEP